MSAKSTNYLRYRDPTLNASSIVLQDPHLLLRITSHLSHADLTNFLVLSFTPQARKRVKVRRDPMTYPAPGEPRPIAALASPEILLEIFRTLEYETLVAVVGRVNKMWKGVLEEPMMDGMMYRLPRGLKGGGLDKWEDIKDLELHPVMDSVHFHIGSSVSFDLAITKRTRNKKTKKIKETTTYRPIKSFAAYNELITWPPVTRLFLGIELECDGNMLANADYQYRGREAGLLENPKGVTVGDVVKGYLKHLEDKVGSDQYDTYYYSFDDTGGRDFMLDSLNQLEFIRHMNNRENVAEKWQLVKYGEDVCLNIGSIGMVERD